MSTILHLKFHLCTYDANVGEFTLLDNNFLIAVLFYIFRSKMKLPSTSSVRQKFSSVRSTAQGRLAIIQLFLGLFLFAWGIYTTVNSWESYRTASAEAWLPPVFIITAVVGLQAPQIMQLVVCHLVLLVLSFASSIALTVLTADLLYNGNFIPILVGAVVQLLITLVAFAFYAKAGRRSVTCYEGGLLQFGRGNISFCAQGCCTVHYYNYTPPQRTEFDDRRSMKHIEYQPLMKNDMTAIETN